MKKFIKLCCYCLCFTLLLSNIGCSGSAKPITEEEAIVEAQLILSQLESGDFSGIIAKSDDNLKGSLTEQMLAEGWVDQGEPVGIFQSVLSAKGVPQGEQMIVQMLSQHSKGQLLLTCSFNSKKQLTGIYVKNDTPAAESLEMSLPEGVREEPVILHAGTSMEINGMIVLPKYVSASTPGVVFAQGSGSSDMDETIGPNKPFRDIAYGLAEKGIASIRYDKVSYAYPELFAGAKFTIDLEYTDTVLEALKVLREKTAVGNVYMLGHSMGGMLTPYFINQSNKSGEGFSGGIIMAGTPRKLWELMYDQNMTVIGLLSDDQKEQNTKLVESERDKALKLSSMTEDELLNTLVFGIPAYYVNHLEGLDEIAFAKENKAPMLIMQGETDFQISLETDFEAWKTGLAGLNNITYKTYPGLNHLFMPETGDIMSSEETYSVPHYLDETAISDISEWILSQ